jgi:hypothetical protein
MAQDTGKRMGSMPQAALLQGHHYTVWQHQDGQRAAVEAAAVPAAANSLAGWPC